MQSLTRVLLASPFLARQWRLSGSDAAEAPDWLAVAGVPVARGHASTHVPPDCELLVYSDAVPADNVERHEAAKRKVSQLSYAQLLGQLMAERTGIAIAGTHGKSTTAAMVAEILVAAGLDPTVIVGAAGLDGLPCARVGRGPHLLAEACEFRANFLHLAPQIAAVLNIEPDHFDCYPTTAALEAAFARFIQQLPASGVLIANADDATTRRLLELAPCRVETVGLSHAADWRAVEVTHERGRYRFVLVHKGERVTAVSLQVAGRHQVANALAAAAVATVAGASSVAVAEGLGRFAGLRRRLENLGEPGGIAIVDDYAHHPTEIVAGLAAVREMYPGRRLWAVFQPHQASRTTHLLVEFAASLQGADHVAVAEIYRAREGQPTADEATADDLARETAALGVDVLPERRPSGILETIHAAARPGDIVVTLGAGDIGNVAHAFVDRLRESCAVV